VSTKESGLRYKYEMELGIKKMCSQMFDFTEQSADCQTDRYLGPRRALEKHFVKHAKQMAQIAENLAECQIDLLMS